MEKEVIVVFKKSGSICITTLANYESYCMNAFHIRRIEGATDFDSAVKAAMGYGNPEKYEFIDKLGD